MRHSVRWALLLALAAGGCGAGDGRRYCESCREIRDLQARPDRPAADTLRLENLKKQSAEKMQNLAAFDSAAGRPPDLHPDCECPCHIYALTHR